jgi:hypothetical protein
MPRFWAMLFLKVLAAIDVILGAGRIRSGRIGRNPGIPCLARAFCSAVIRPFAGALRAGHSPLDGAAEHDSAQSPEKHLSTTYERENLGSTAQARPLWLMPRQSFSATIGFELIGECEA